jgi:hypothetical protein
MTALATHRPDQSAAEGERVIRAALSKHGCEQAARIGDYAQRPGIDDEQRRILRAAQRIVMGEDL